MEKYLLDIDNLTEIVFSNKISLFNYFNDNLIYNYKIKVLKDKTKKETTFAEIFLNSNCECVINYILENNIPISYNLYFIFLNICITKSNDNYVSLFNKIISFEYFYNTFSNINAKSFKSIKDSIYFLEIDKIEIIERIINENTNSELALNKFYQILITFLLNRTSIIDKEYLIKNYEFNTVFLNKNVVHFDKILLALYQKNKSKEIKSTIDLIRDELTSYIEFKDIDINIFNEYLKYIYINYIGNLTKEKGFEIYYYHANCSKEIDYIINNVNTGDLNLNSNSFAPSCLNKYILESLNINKKLFIRNINCNAEIIPLYGLYGSCDVKDVCYRKMIIKKNNIETQTLFTIIKPIKKNEKLINIILFIIIDVDR